MKPIFYLKLCKSTQLRQYQRSNHSFFHRYLYNFREHLGGFEFSCNRISAETKQNMVFNLHGNKSHSQSCSLIESSQKIEVLDFYKFVTQNTKLTFSLPMKDAYKFADDTFLKTNPSSCEENTCFQEFQRRTINLTIQKYCNY